MWNDVRDRVPDADAIAAEWSTKTLDEVTPYAIDALAELEAEVRSTTRSS